MKTALCMLSPMVLSLGLCSTVAAELALAETPDAQRAAEYAKLTPSASRYILNDDTLPGFELAQPEQVRTLLGSYQLKSTVYGPDYQVVARASTPGRHGAVVEIIPGSESKLPSSRRFVTLYRLPDKSNFEQQAPALVARLKASRWNFKDVPVADSAENARTLSALHEVPRATDPADFYQGSVEKERQWWIGLKRQLYGFDRDQRFALPFRSPRPLEEKRARVVREGALAETGMKAEAPRTIDVVLTRWAEDSPEGFDVCIVRHGVVAFEKSYGKSYQGKPVTSDTMFPLTSTSKMITGLMLMQLVDQGRLDLDRPITELPGPLHGIKTQKPITLRALYTHTAFSLDFHPTPDLEERLAVVLPQTPIGQGYQYTGTSLELAWSLASLASGKSISTFARDHLLEPLGCKHTEVFNTGGATQSTAHDLARIGQMLLNRGAYGDKRYLSEKTFEEMLPRRLTQTLGPYTNDRVWGVGTMPWRVTGLSPFTLGHKGYYRSTAFIDPIHDLVVIMTRVDPPSGKKYDQYHPQFLKAVVEGLSDPLPAFPEALTMTDLNVPSGKDHITIETVVENSGPTDAVLEYRYETAGTRWQFDPAAARIKLPAKGKTTVRVEARFDPKQSVPLPKLHGAVYAATGPLPPQPHVEYWVRPILRRSVTAQRVSKTPTSDGVIRDEEYGKMPLEQQLLETHGRKEPLYPTRFRVAYDDKAVYVAVEAAEKAPRTLTSLVKQRDDPAIKKEAYIEVVFDMDDDGKGRQQFAVNLKSVQFDAQYGAVTWDARWTATVRLGEDNYVVEFAIPYEALGGQPPRSGARWGLNVARGRGPRDARWELFAQWVMTYADFNSEKHFGVLQFQ